jgi:uncharacterized protein
MIARRRKLRRRYLLFLAGCVLGGPVCLWLMSSPAADPDPPGIIYAFQADTTHLSSEETTRLGKRRLTDFLALFPSKHPDGDWRNNGEFEDCWMKTADGVRLHGWYAKHAAPRAIVLFAHGNAGNITHRAARALRMRNRCQVSILLFDYRGYGRSGGVATLEGLPHDTAVARDFLAAREGLTARQLVLMGESLGGAMVVDVASRDGARAVILESTFSSLQDVAATHYPRFLVRRLVPDRLDSAVSIARYGGPLLQMHGDRDGIVPLALGQKLFAAANEPKQFVLLEGHDHNDMLPERGEQALLDFLSDLP